MAFGIKRLSSKSAISIGTKIDALAKVIVGGEDPEKVIAEVYKEAKRPIPEKPKARLVSWRQEILKRGKAGEQAVIDLCEDQGIFEEVPDTKPKAAAKRKPKPAAVTT